MLINLKKILLLSMAAMLLACTHIPAGLEPVQDFELQRYLGTWYEIARLDHRFERGLTAIQAEYSLNRDGGVKVLNSGVNQITGEREQAEGVAYFLNDPSVGSLKVSFFRPFYGGYHIIVLDRDAYQYAMVTGPNRDYLWILSRLPDMDQAVLQSLIERAQSWGFAVDKLIFTTHP